MQGGLNFNNDKLKKEIFKECNTVLKKLQEKEERGKKHQEELNKKYEEKIRLLIDQGKTKEVVQLLQECNKEMMGERDRKSDFLMEIACTAFHKDEINNANYATINYQEPSFGSTPLTLAVAKGYKHISPDPSFVGTQKEILDCVLQNPNVNMNLPHKIGLTALEIAILRGDDLELIQKLIQKGATMPDKERLDELLSIDYESMQKIVCVLTTGCELTYEEDENAFSNYGYASKENREDGKLSAATMSVAEDFYKNKEQIKEFAGKQSMTLNFDSLNEAFFKNTTIVNDKDTAKPLNHYQRGDHNQNNYYTR